MKKQGLRWHSHGSFAAWAAGSGLFLHQKAVRCFCCATAKKSAFPDKVFSSMNRNAESPYGAEKRTFMAALGLQRHLLSGSIGVTGQALFLL